MPDPITGDAPEGGKSPDENKIAGASEREGKAEPETTMLEAVQKALADDGQDAASPDQSEQKDTTDPASEKKDGVEGDEKPKDEDPDKEVDQGELSDEEKATLSERTQNRIKSLVSERNEFKGQLEELSPKAEALDKLRDFMTENRLASDDVDQAFNIASMVRNKPAEALVVLENIVGQLRTMTGAALPDDLSEQVRLGYVTEPAAQELSRARAEAARREQLDAERTAENEQQTQMAEFQKSVDASVSAADSWYQSKAKIDPDFGMKHKLIGELAELEMHRMGRVPTPDETVAVLDNLLKRVESQTKQFAPPKRPNDPVDGPASSASATPAPTSMLEAMQQGLARASR